MGNTDVTMYRKSGHEVIYDQEADRINKTRKPIPVNSITVRYFSHPRSLSAVRKYRNNPKNIDMPNVGT